MPGIYQGKWHELLVALIALNALSSEAEKEGKRATNPGSDATCSILISMTAIRLVRSYGRQVEGGPFYVRSLMAREIRGKTANLWRVVLASAGAVAGLNQGPNLHLPGAPVPPR